MEFDFFVPTKIIFGQGRMNEIGAVNLPGSKALIAVTADGIMKKLGYLDKLTDLLDKNNVEYTIYDQVQPNPTRKGVMEAAELIKNENCDFTIGLGGGSSIDTAKASAAMAKNPGDLWDYAYAGTGKKHIFEKAIPIVTVTTTAGTGTEVDPWCVITNEETGEKLDFGSPLLFPCISVIDPELMLSVPKELTAFQGLDALFHAIEGYIATCATPLSDMFALEAINKLSKYLPKVVHDGADIKARSEVSYAANVICGFVQSTSSCTSPHLIGQTLGGLYPGIPHGASLIMIAEAYYNAVVDKVPDRFSKMAKVMSEAKGKTNEIHDPSTFIKELRELLTVCGVSNLKMSDYGIKKEDLLMIANHAMSIDFELDRYSLSLRDIVDMLERSYK
jgi:alcohol dehydrogenase